MLQQHGEKWQLNQCGSRFLSDTKRRYATMELELLAAVWATRKCRLYLLGLPAFELVVDHKPLIPILNAYTLDAVINPLLQRLKEKLAGYTFTAVWRKGKHHAIPDALSRAPVDQPDVDDLQIDHEMSSFIWNIVLAASTELSEFDDPVLDEIRYAALAVTVYQQLISHVTGGFPSSKSRPCTVSPSHRCSCNYPKRNIVSPTQFTSWH